jgi:hypothetical protein
MTATYLKQVKRCRKCSRLYMVGVKHCYVCKIKLVTLEFDHTRQQYAAVAKKPAAREKDLTNEQQS